MSTKDLEQAMLSAIEAKGLDGLEPARMPGLGDVSRSTINRVLAALVAKGDIRAIARGRNTRYILATDWPDKTLDAFFGRPVEARPAARFNEALLAADPGWSMEQVRRCERMQARVRPLDQRFFTRFVVDLAWGSSVLEGSSYSRLDTQAVIAYGQRNPEKPAADGVLALDHQNAARWLWGHRALNHDNLLHLHGLLTDSHGVPGAEASDHFVDDHQRGVLRDDAGVHIHGSTDVAPFRPARQAVPQWFDQIIDQAKTLHPIQAMLYLMSRLPYLQPFVHGNKRVSRMAANAAVLQAGLVPVSFAQMNRAHYLRGILSFCELQTIEPLSRVLMAGYVRSIVLSSDLPGSNRTAAAFDLETIVKQLTGYVLHDQRPEDPIAKLMLSAGLPKRSTADRPSTTPTQAVPKGDTTPK